MLNREILNTLYWFWSQIIRQRHGMVSNKPYFERLDISTYKGLINQFNKLLIIMAYNGTYNGQTKAEFKKNFTRINGIIGKTDELDKQITLAQTQANRITDEWKAINRAMAAKELGHEHLFEVFFRRAYELGNVPTQEYRDYQLSKLGI